MSNTGSVGQLEDESKRMVRRRWLLILLGGMAVSTLLLAFALRGKPRSADLSWHDVRNTAYQSEFPRSKVAHLVNGSYEEEYVPGAATKLRIRMADIGSFGLVDQDTANDAAVVLITEPGGSGTFIHLVAVLNRQGRPEPVTPVLLGDRVAVRALSIADRKVHVRLRVRGSGDPMVRLTHEVDRTYALAGDQLILESEIEVPPVQETPPQDRFVHSPTRIEFGSGAGDTSASGTLKPGGIADYVLRGGEGQTGRIQVRSEFGNAILSVFGLTDTEELVSRTAYATGWAGVFPSSQDYAVKVITVAGHDISYTLTVELHAGTPTPVPTSTPRPGPTPVTTIPSLPSPTPPGSTTLPGDIRLTDQPLARLSPEVMRFLEPRAPTWSVAVVVPALGSIYMANGDQQLETASVVKVLVMLAVLDQVIMEGRHVGDDELELLWPMITESDNDSTTALWNQLGGGPVVAAYLRRIGVTGITPYNGAYWGTTRASARGMAIVLAHLAFGDILDKANRDLALDLLTSVIPSRRRGVCARPRGQGTHRGTVGLKGGWYPAPEGWRVNSVGVILSALNADPSYSIAVMTNSQGTMRYGVETIENVAAAIHQALHQ